MSEAKTQDILGIGNPLLDISAVVDQAFLDKYELVTNNAILAEDKHLPIYDELKGMPNVEFIAGGATLNAIRVCQWCLHDRPGSTAYIGCIGKDEFGTTLETCVKKDGVSPYFKITEEVGTGTCAVLVHKKDRSLCANLAAANKYEISHLQQDEITKVYESAKIFYIAGFFLTVSLPTILAIGEHCAKEAKIMCMNLSAPFIPQFFGSQLAEAIKYVDFLFGNETEAETYGKVNNLKDCSLEAVAAHIAALPKANESRKRIVVFTQGMNQTLIVQDGEDPIAVAVPQLDADKIVDLNGAGDAFVGGFLSRLLSGATPSVAAEAGHKAARFIIQRSGTVLEGKPDF